MRLFRCFTNAAVLPNYHRLADKTLQAMQEALENAINLPELDVELSSGVLTLRLGPPFGTFVINKQPPNRQIWWSSPVSGPRRFALSQEFQSPETMKITSKLPVWLDVRLVAEKKWQDPLIQLENRLGYELSSLLKDAALNKKFLDLYESLMDQ